MLDYSNKKRFLRPSIYTTSLTIHYYNEMNEYKVHTFVKTCLSKKDFSENLEDIKRIRDYIEMNMGSSYFPVEYKQECKQEKNEDRLFSMLNFMHG
jgi:hypothetical protein